MEALANPSPHMTSIEEVITEALKKTGIVSSPGERELIWLLGESPLPDILWCLEHFARICFITLNPASIQASVQRHGQASRRITIFASIDASGMDDYFPEFFENPPDIGQFTATLWRYQHHPMRPLFGRGTIVVSSVLNQILNRFTGVFRNRNGLEKGIDLLLTKHMDLLWRLACPGGSILIAGDLTSSRRVSALERTDPDCISLMRRVLRTGNYFPGTNPYELIELIERTAEPDLIERSELFEPWIRTTEARLHYLCWAMLFHRAMCELPADEPVLRFEDFR